MCGHSKHSAIQGRTAAKRYGLGVRTRGVGWDQVALCYCVFVERTHSIGTKVKFCVVYDIRCKGDSWHTIPG